MTVSFRSKLLASHALVALATGAVAMLVVEHTVSRRMEAELDHRLEAQGRAVASWVGQARHFDKLAPRLAGVMGTRVTVIDQYGTTLGESAVGDAGAAAASGVVPPEVALARSTAGIGHATRREPGDAEPVRYVALAAPKGLTVRLGAPLGPIEQTRSTLRRQLGVAAGASLGVAFLLAAVLAAAMTRRLRAASALAARIGRHDYDSLPTSHTADEVGVLARTLADAATQLRESEAERRAFLANVAHELRTPITSIRGFAETLAEGGSDVDAETQREFLGRIHHNALRVGRLVDDLLELEELTAHARTESVLLGEVVDHVIGNLRLRAEEHGARIDVDLTPDLTARADADGVERIVQNLIDNALRHGGAGVQIGVRGQVRNARIVLVVGDDGPGIPAVEAEQVFRRFQRGQAAADRPGSGLGLAIARELAERMGGSLTLTPSDRGASFTLELPACVPPANRLSRSG